MANRVRLKSNDSYGRGGGIYFDATTVLKRFSSGCQLLDEVLGGGWALGRMINLVGDKSTGKTLLAIEACANFAQEYPKGKIYYVEAEAAFDTLYAESLGLPLDRVEFMDELDTVEDIFEHLQELVGKKKKKRVPTLYIVDSWDALTDRAEQGRKIDEGTYGGNKPKQTGTLFRRLVKKLGKAQLSLFIVSQVRENIGVSFGEKYRRSGGKALDFYASQIVWLAHLRQIAKIKKNVKRPIGIEIRAKCKKNKAGLPFRECEFPLMFGFGVDDVKAAVKWLIQVKRHREGGFKSKDAAEAFLKTVDKLKTDEYMEVRADLNEAVHTVWLDIEKGFAPRRCKY